jgi:hypothetical protein
MPGTLPRTLIARISGNRGPCVETFAFLKPPAPPAQRQAARNPSNRTGATLPAVLSNRARRRPLPLSGPRCGRADLTPIREHSARYGPFPAVCSRSGTAARALVAEKNIKDYPNVAQKFAGRVDRSADKRARRAILIRLPGRDKAAMLARFQLRTSREPTEKIMPGATANAAGAFCDGELFGNDRMITGRM